MLTFTFRRAVVAAGLVGSALSAHAQVVPPTFPANGPRDDRAGRVAFTHATIFPDAATRLEDATLLIENGRVVAVGRDIKLPAGTTEIDQRGRFIYPGLVDAFSGYGLPAKPRGGRSRRQGPQFITDKDGPFGWNEALRPEVRGVEMFGGAEEPAAGLRKLGFGAVLALPQDGVLRGTGALVTLNTRRRENQTVLRPEAAAGLSFDKGSSTQNYPESLMGAIALLRQTYLDAAWQGQNPAAEQNLSLAAVRAQRGLPQIFEVRDKLSLLRADRVGDEAGVQYIIKTAGDEYQRLAEVKATGAALIVPLNFPAAYNVEDVYDADDIPLEYLQHWELAPTNPGAVARAGIPFALTLAGLKDPAQFWPNVRKAIQHGLSEADAFRALTTTPARLLGAADRVGALRPGQEANFFIATAPVFTDSKALILDSWVQGDHFPVVQQPADYRGTYRLRVQGQPERTLIVRGKPEAPEARLVVAPGDTLKATISFQRETITLAFAPKPATPATPGTPAPPAPGTQRLAGFYTGTGFSGKADLAGGSAPVSWTATQLTAGPPDAARRDSAAGAPVVGALTYPLGAYGLTAAPPAETVLIRNATVWTSDAAGTLTGADVLIGANGKIAAVGRGLKEPKGARVIDGTGRHLTAGIIDEHSHIAIAEGVNEGSQSVTAEVRIGDVLDPDDITIYRQLAGGKTTTQLLHGSANAIGGQSALVKLRWGVAPEALKIAGAPEFIKFALGENVKQSNWGDANTTRFPQTRMGVEQVIDDAFRRAKEYETARAAYAKLGKKDQAKTTAPRRDLELDALVEILRDRRFITCHSYVQSEILMLIRAAERNGFRVNTFTHILEGYKVANELKAHGANASTFSDWWAYKNEVKEAIPYNAAIMHDVGLNVAINSDDHEMARRLNQEAAKTVKYGGLTEEEALKTITINPARMLHLEKQIGSIVVGKDADLVLWSAPPLSIYARAERTYVDGRCYYSLEQDQALRQRRDQERERLIQKLLAAKRSGEPTQGPKAKPGRKIDCEDFDYDYADDVRE